MLAWLWLVGLLPLSVCGQTDNEVCGYRFTTGVDSNVWEDLSLHLSYVNPQFDYFEFFIGEDRVQGLSLSPQGVIYVNNQYATLDTAVRPFDSVGFLSRAPLLAPVGCRSDVNVTACRSGLKNEEGDSVYVIELELRIGAGDTSSYRLVQVQLRSSDNSITFVYGELWDTLSVYMQLGMAITPTEYIVINQMNHSAAASDTNALQGRGWPGGWRYYRFEPACAIPKGIQVKTLTTTSARVSWLGDGQYWFA